MPIKRYKPEQIVTMLRQIEVGIANGRTTPQACKEAEITIQTFYRWRKEYGGLKMDQAKRMKELEKENGKLKRLVAERALDKQILKDIAEGHSRYAMKHPLTISDKYRYYEPGTIALVTSIVHCLWRLFKPITSSVQYSDKMNATQFFY